MIEQGFEIDESMLRAAIKQDRIPKNFPFTVAKRFLYSDRWGFDHFEHVAVYGSKNIKKLVVQSRYGYKLNESKIGQVGRGGSAYCDAAEIIEAYANTRA